METLKNLIKCTTSAQESASTALNAAHDAYHYNEAERKNKLGQLLEIAARELQKKGVPAQEALNLVAVRGQYLQELSRGKKTFVDAAKIMKSQPATTTLTTTLSPAQPTQQGLSKI